MYKIKTINKSELYSWVHEIATKISSPLIGLLLGGDRITCCDEAVALEVDGVIIGVVTIAPEGEEYTGRPTLVALYVVPAERKKGYGQILQEAGIRRCIERGLTDNNQTILIETLGTRAFKTTERLPQELKDVIEVRDFSNLMYDEMISQEKERKK